MPKLTTPIEVLIEQLHGEDWTARCDAARLLGQSGDPRAVDALLPDLQDSDWRVRRNAAQALGALRDQRAVEPLIQALADRTLTVRQRAIVALGRIKDLRALPALLQILLENKRESYDASKAIRKFGKKALPEMVRAFEKNQDEGLLLLLVELKYEGAFNLLIQLLENGKLSSQQLAIRELGRVGDKRGIPYLVKQLDHHAPIVQSQVVEALGKLGAIEAIPALLDLLKGDDLYGPQAAVYHAVTSAFQHFAHIDDDIQNVFPGKYPAMFNMGGAPFSLPEAMGFMGNAPSDILSNTLARFQTGMPDSEQTANPLTNMVHKAIDDVAWKFGVMFADARDARQERIKRLGDLLKSESNLQRAAAALSLPWYGEAASLEQLRPLAQDPDEMVSVAASWATTALQKTISQRNQFGM